MPGFLSATWRHLVIATYRVPADRLAPLLPDGVTLDLWEGSPLVSLLGVEMCAVRVRGIPVPFHRRFADVNFRCYARRADGAPGVVFLKEIVPRYAVALLARLAFNEKFVARPVRHRADRSAGEVRMEYRWTDGGSDHALRAVISGSPEPIATGSLEEFVMERRRGFVAKRGGGVLTYVIGRDRWRWWRPRSVEVAADAAVLYGEQFRGLFDEPPLSAVVAEGSAITVRKTVE